MSRVDSGKFIDRTRRHYLRYIQPDAGCEYVRNQPRTEQTSDNADLFRRGGGFLFGPRMVATLKPIRTSHSGGKASPPLGDDDGLFEPLKVTRKNGLVIAQDVPLVDEHEIYDEEGNFIANADEAFLRWVAASNNRRVRETGDEIVVTAGHTEDNKPERLQPPVVGHCRDLYVADLVN